jgi:hypothetical protein
MERLVFRTIFAMCCAGLVAAARPDRARAEELGNRGNLVFGAERLFGFYLDKQSSDVGGRSLHNDSTVVGLGWGNSVSMLTTPRLGADYFLTDNFSLGGNLGFVSTSGDAPTSTGVLFGARAGYALRLSHAVAFWPRAGLTYASVSVQGSPDSWNVFALTLDAPFTIAPSEGFAFTAGPVLDLGFTGAQFGPDYTEVLFGLMFGLSGWLSL